VNTAEIITGEICGTAAFLGLTVGYTWLYLHYAKQGVLKFGKPVERSSRKKTSAGDAPAETGEPAPVPIGAGQERTAA
jgi:hypothetical protein